MYSNSEAESTVARGTGAEAAGMSGCVGAAAAPTLAVVKEGGGRLARLLGGAEPLAEWDALTWATDTRRWLVSRSLLLPSSEEASTTAERLGDTDRLERRSLPMELAGNITHTQKRKEEGEGKRTGEKRKDSK